MAASHIVRGYGPLDMFLAKQRYKIAKKQIKLVHQRERILDIGCGSYPFFLTTVDFSERYGMDRMVQTNKNVYKEVHGITLINYDFENEQKLPFQNDFFDVISALAVFEHIEPGSLVKIHREIHRILKPGGVYIMTTPAFWTDRLLRFLAKIHLISDVEIKDHKGSYNHLMISSILQEAHFEKNKLQFGYFELFMNIWATSTK
jgi:demethylmenaquinone methyltransferase/2-methoxy-6-polyprenyl-1,4-benzoquinol methylase